MFYFAFIGEPVCAGVFAVIFCCACFIICVILPVAIFFLNIFWRVLDGVEVFVDEFNEHFSYVFVRFWFRSCKMMFCWPILYCVLCM